MVPIISWIVVMVLLIIGEASTVGLTFIWFAVGALGGLIAAALHAALWVQIAVFLFVSALALVLVRPAAKRFMAGSVSPTNADRIIGRVAVVTQAIDNLAGQGQVKVAGQIWTARSEHGLNIPADTRVKVLRIEGVKVFVEAV